MIDVDLIANGNSLFSPFTESNVRGASYDISVGDVVILLRSLAEGGPEYVSLDLKRSHEIPSGRVAIVKSKELLTVPPNVKGRLSGKADFATQLVFFSGGIVDPGFSGHLWLPVANLNTTGFELHHNEPFVRLELTKLRARVDRPHPALEVPGIPNLPDSPQDPVLDGETMSRKLRELEAKARLFEPTSQVVQGVLLAAIGGITAALGFKVFDDLELQVPAAGAVAGAIALVSLGAIVRIIYSYTGTR
jgi:deoxycytidine triphosphate deaminase